MDANIRVNLDSDKMKFIDPRIDFAFKKIFGSEEAKDILISFLESLMGLEGDKRIQEITILDPFLAPQIQEMKNSVLDVRCKDHRGISYIVEMQVRKTRAFLKRIQFKAKKVYVNQISKGDAYPKLNQVVAITITDFSLFDDFDHYVSQHQTQETITGKSLMQEVVYWFVELSKFNKSLEELDTVLDKWIFFIKMASDLDVIPSSFQEDPFHYAFERARVANMGRQELEYYYKAGIAIADARGAIELALEEGEQIGVIKGEQIGIIKGEQLGIIKGEQIGIIKGEQRRAATTLLRQLEHKFGSLSEHEKEKIMQADLSTLEIGSLRILDAKSMDDLF